MACGSCGKKRGYKKTSGTTRTTTRTTGKVQKNWRRPATGNRARVPGKTVAR